jgi:hypothetical protein
MDKVNAGLMLAVEEIAGVLMEGGVERRGISVSPPCSTCAFSSSLSITSAIGTWRTTGGCPESDSPR